jgi:uncharacterized protein YndB with AHSA1/START domain
MRRIEVEHLYPHPAERVFRRYCDHASWSDWAGVGRVYLTREGSPDANGVGAVRAFSANPGLREEVTAFEPPSRMEYRIVQGPLPIRDHHGEVFLTPEGSGTKLTWRVTFDTSLPGLGWVVERALTMVFRRMLAGLAKDLDRRS